MAPINPLLHEDLKRSANKGATLRKMARYATSLFKLLKISNTSNINNQAENRSR